MKRTGCFLIITLTICTLVHAEECTTFKGFVHPRKPELKYYITPKHYLYSKIHTLDAARGERCFQTEDEAKAAGFFKLPDQPTVEPSQANTTSAQGTPTPKPRATTSTTPQWAMEWQKTPYNERIKQSTVALLAVNPALKNDNSLQDKAINLEACVSESTKRETVTMFKGLAQCMTACVIILEYAE